MTALAKRRWGSLGIAALIVVALVIWMLSGDVRRAASEAPPVQDASTESGDRRIAVEIARLSAESYQPAVVFQGQLEPWRRVQIRARVNGSVESVAVELGDQVSEGDRLLSLSADARPALARQAEARVRQLRAELRASQSLRQRNLASESDILGLESDLASAQASLEEIRLQLADISPLAPFDGRVNDRQVEPGLYVKVGDPMIELVQVDRLKLTGMLPQQSIASISPGQPVEINLLDGEPLTGEIAFIASAADPETRSFRIEARVDNADQRRLAGASATGTVRLAPVQALKISPAYLQLDRDGRMGVMHVDDNDRVVFSPVDLLAVTTEAAWIAGLGNDVRLITRGAGFVSQGDKVSVVEQSASGNQELKASGDKLSGADGRQPSDQHESAATRGGAI